VLSKSLCNATQGSKEIRLRQQWGADLGIEGLSADAEAKRTWMVAARVAVPAGRQQLPLDLAGFALLSDEVNPRASNYRNGILSAWHFNTTKSKFGSSRTAVGLPLIPHH
jgi:hypothetical protein